MRKSKRARFARLKEMTEQVELSKAAQELISETTQEEWVDDNTPLAEVLVFSADPLDVLDFFKKNAA